MTNSRRASRTLREDVVHRSRALVEDGVEPVAVAAPWFEPGALWSVRRVAIHVLTEISQHAGHPDIIREAIDGARTMG